MSTTKIFGFEVFPPVPLCNCYSCKKEFPEGGVFVVGNDILCKNCYHLQFAKCGTVPGTSRIRSTSKGNINKRKNSAFVHQQQSELAVISMPKQQTVQSEDVEIIDEGSVVDTVETNKTKKTNEITKPSKPYTKLPVNNKANPWTNKWNCSSKYHWRRKDYAKLDKKNEVY